MEQESKTIRDLTGKVLLFPQATKTAHVKLTPTQENFTAVTVCHRTFTDIKRDYALFPMALPTRANSFITYWDSVKQAMRVYVNDAIGDFAGLDYGLNKWHSICVTWDSSTGLVDMWLNGQPLVKKYTSEEPLCGKPIITLGQEQDAYGGRFNLEQSFVGMMTDVHMWDYVLSDREIQKYMKDQRFTPGNVVNWGALDCEINGRVVIENRRSCC